MTPAAWPRADALRDRLLLVDPIALTFTDARVQELTAVLHPGDLLVLNDAATLPSSLSAEGPGGEPMEVRLAGAAEDGEWLAVLFGAGDWRQRTEDRPAPPALTPGAHIRLPGGLAARVTAVSDLSPRLVQLRFDRDGQSFWSALYRVARPVQYSYLRAALELRDVQTSYAARPWAHEPPSAGRPLTVGLLLELRRHGVETASLTHAAGLSATGDAALDALLPLPERYEIPAATVEAVSRARGSGGRVLATGTTVVRALEGNVAQHGRLVAGGGMTDLRIDAAFRPRVVNGLLTGLHEPDSSHFRLLAAFAPADLLARAWSHAEEAGYLAHEFGDSSLILAA